MARTTLHAHVGNPNNLESLPATRPRLKFCTKRVLKRSEELKFMLLVLSISTACSFVAIPWMSFDYSDLSILLFMAMVVWARRPVVARIIPLSFVISFSLPLLIGIWHPNVLELAGSAIGLLLFVAWLFRRHYLACCTTGWYPFNRKQHRWGVPTPRAFFDALVLWLNYNRHRACAPGVQQSPAGPYILRVLLTITSIIYLGVALPMLAMLAIGDEPPRDLALLLAWQLSFVTPLPVFLLTLFVVSAPVLGRCYRSKQTATGEEGLSECWPQALEHICTSPDKVERESLYLGQVAHDNAPVLVPLETARKHIWAVGGTGSGKTTFLTSLVEQFGYRGDTSIFVGDLKADTYELLATLDWVHKSVKEKTGREMPFWKLTNRSGLASHFFSLFHQAEWSRLGTTQKTDVLMAAMALSYSRSFGESWYSDACYHLLHFVLEKYPEVASFRELSQRIGFEIKAAREHELSRAVKQDGEHVRLVVERLARNEAFNYRDGLPEEVIHGGLQLGRLFQEPCLVYGAFSALLAPTTSPELLRVIVSALLTIGTMVTPRTTRILLVLDEWQRMVAGNLELLLQQARSQGISVVLANQTVADLQQGSIDLTSTVEGNTSVQAWFKDMDQAGMEQNRMFGGLTVDTLRDHTVSAAGDRSTVTTKEILVNRLEINEIAAASSRPNTFILRVTDNQGYAHYDGLPFLARYGYHISQDEYRRRQRFAWPQPTAETILLGQPASVSHRLPFGEPTPYPSKERVVDSHTIGIDHVKRKSGKSDGRTVKGRKHQASDRGRDEQPGDISRG